MNLISKGLFSLVFSLFLTIQESDARIPITELPIPVIKQGTAIIKGQISSYKPNSKNIIKVSLYNHFKNNSESFEVEISNDGSFKLPVLLLHPTIALFVSDYYKEYIVIAPGDSCFIEIDASKIADLSNFNPLKRENLNDQYVHFEGAFADVNNDLNLLRFWAYNIPSFNNKIKEQIPVQHKTVVLKDLETSLASFKQKSLSKRTFELIAIELQQKAVIKILELDPFWDNYKIIKNYPEPTVDTTYFSFLKDFNINTPYSLYGRSFSTLIRQLIRLEDRTLSYNDLVAKSSKPEMELTLEDLSKQKNYLTKILGENSGILFDMLEMQNFTEKLNLEIPLIEWEKERLKELSNPIYYQYLNEINDSLLSQLNTTKKNPKAILIDATGQESVNYTNEIIKLHKGKTILVTYWSIGCIYALNAINDLTTLSEKYKEKDVVFIYFTDDHFLYKVWENKANRISGFNYRLRKDQMDYFNKKHDFTGTPSFLIIDKNGEFIFTRKGLFDSNRNDIISALDSGS